ETVLADYLEERHTSGSGRAVGRLAGREADPYSAPPALLPWCRGPPGGPGHWRRLQWYVLLSFLNCPSFALAVSGTLGKPCSCHPAPGWSSWCRPPSSAPLGRHDGEEPHRSASSSEPSAVLAATAPRREAAHPCSAATAEGGKRAGHSRIVARPPSSPHSRRISSAVLPGEPLR